MKTFKEAWKETGYQYGQDALENVELGWNMCLAAIIDELLKQNQKIVEEHELKLTKG